MKKKLALGLAGASTAIIAGWKMVRQLVDRDGEQTDAVSVAPGMPAEAAAGADIESVPAPPREAEAPPATKVDSSSSKAELYEVAQELDIDGRSKMSKAELLAAIEKAS